MEGVWTEDIDGSKVTICLNHLIKKRTKIFSHFLVLLYQFLPTWSIKTLLLSLEKLTSLLVILSFHIWVSKIGEETISSLTFTYYYTWLTLHQPDNHSYQQWSFLVHHSISHKTINSSQTLCLFFHTQNYMNYFQ